MQIPSGAWIFSKLSKHLIYLVFVVSSLIYSINYLVLKIPSKIMNGFGFVVDEFS